MNNERRARIKTAHKMIKDALQILESVKDDEEDAFDNLSEGLQQTMRGEQMEENVDTLDGVIETIEDALGELSGM